MNNPLAGSRVMVTGGAGLVGSHIVDQLLEEDVAEILVVDNLARGRCENLDGALQSGHVRLLEADIRDAHALRPLMEGVDYVSHQAAIRSIAYCEDAPRDALDVLVIGSFNVFEAAAAAGVRKLVFASSISVYGEPSYVPTDEDHPYNNSTAYGAGKIAGEQFLRYFGARHALPYLCMRQFNTYGPRMDIAGSNIEVIIRWLDAIDRGDPIYIYGDEDQSVDLIYITDTARANVLALKSPASGDVVNVASGRRTLLQELAQELIDLTGISVPIHFRPNERVLVRQRQAAVDKARRLLGFEAQVPLREGLRRLIEWRAGALAPVAP